jgi:hypothetical protein
VGQEAERAQEEATPAPRVSLLKGSGKLVLGGSLFGMAMVGSNRSGVMPGVGVGAAFSWTTLLAPDAPRTARLPLAAFQANHGLDVHGEVGVGWVQARGDRLSLGLRVDVPLYSLSPRTEPAASSGSGSGAGEASRATTAGSLYAVPVSLVATLYLP